MGRSRSTPLKRSASGGLVSSRSKTGDPACSQAMSAWVTGRNKGIVPSWVFQVLGMCRAKARLLKMGAAQRNAGNEARAQALAHRANSGGPLTAKDRTARAKQLVSQRAAVSKATHEGTEKAAHDIAAVNRRSHVRSVLNKHRSIYKARIPRAKADAATRDLPEITGSDKQVKWAKDIRAKHHAQLSDLEKKIANGPATPEIKASFARHKAAVLGKTSARDWIDGRDQRHDERWFVDKVKAEREGTKATSSKPPAQTPTVHQHKAFADVVHEAARKLHGEGKASGSKVFINHIHAEATKAGPLKGMPLDEFKMRLLAGNNARTLDLARADLAPAFSRNDQRESEITHGRSEFHFVNIAHRPKSAPSPKVTPPAKPDSSMRVLRAKALRDWRLKAIARGDYPHSKHGKSSH